MATFEQQDGPAALQEVYRHLDATTVGNRNIAWYGQCRAAGSTHAKALQETIDYFDISREDWYRVRFPEEVGG